MRTAKRRLEFEREIRRWAMDDLSKKTGIIPSTLSEFETGKRIPSRDELEQLAAVFEISDEMTLMNVGYIELCWEELISARELGRQQAELLKEEIEQLEKTT